MSVIIGCNVLVQIRISLSDTRIGLKLKCRAVI